ncbi:MAG: hypothetical protein NUV64_03590 [Parcubacteria group bacterium]|nr:hypothetical protein [Parcubacteria group bacterium]MCR4342330.1 hypothetical protein [Patescibacteria group bacterium]
MKEQKKCKEDNYVKVAMIVLKIIGTAGLVSMILLAPNALQALDVFYGKDKKKYYKKGYLDRSIDRLKRGGYIEFKKRNGRVFVSLTEKGKEKLLKYQLGELKIKKSKRWDRKWRIITFDIRESRRGVRNTLRRELVNLGFIKLQNSVWVYPYDCEEVVIMLKSYLRVGKDILYVVAERIENDKWLKQEFKLI